MAAIPPLSHPKYPLPIDVRLKLPDPTTPWKIGDRIMDEMSAQASSSYRKVEVLPEDPEWNFIHAMFHQDKPIRWDMIGAYCIHEPHQTRSFELNLVTQDREADKFTPTWHSEPRAEQRARVIDRWRKTTEPFSPFQTMESGGRSEPLTKVHVLPLWHGSSYEVCASVAETGFTFFGKKSIGQKSAGDPKSTDEGFFGSGIYFTNSARYAADIYSTGHLVLAWVSAREPFPVVGDPKQTDMQTLQGRGAYKHYNAHYIPVCPQEMSALCAMYFPCKEGETAFCDEVVVFQKVQTLPRFWVALQPSALHLMQPKVQVKTADGKVMDSPHTTLLKVNTGNVSYKSAIAWSVDGQSVFHSNYVNKAIYVWDLEGSRQPKTVYWSPESYLDPLVWSPDRTRFLSAEDKYRIGWLVELYGLMTGAECIDYNLCVFNMDTSKNTLEGQRVMTLKGHTKKIYAYTWSPDGKKALTGSEDMTVRIWDVVNGKLTKTLKGHKHRVRSVEWSPDGGKFLSGDEETIRIWNAMTHLPFHIITLSSLPKELSSCPESLSWSPDGSHILTSGGWKNKGVNIWDASSGVHQKTLAGGTSPAAWSPNGKYIAAHGLGGRLHVRHVTDGKLHLNLKVDAQSIKLLAWSFDSKYILTAGEVGDVCIWEVP